MKNRRSVMTEKELIKFIEQLSKEEEVGLVFTGATLIGVFGAALIFTFFG